MASGNWEGSTRTEIILQIDNNQRIVPGVNCYRAHDVSSGIAGEKGIES